MKHPALLTQTMFENRRIYCNILKHLTVIELCDIFKYSVKKVLLTAYVIYNIKFNIDVNQSE